MPEVLTDDELLAVADDPELAPRLNSEERRRLTRLRGTQPKPEARTWTDTAVDALPMAGGMLGGALGAISGIPTLGLGSAPGAVVGAGMLGAGGEAARQLINRARGKEAPVDRMEIASQIGAQGALQAGSEVLGQGLVKGAEMAGKAVYRGFLKPSLSKQSIAKADQIVQTALDEALPITKAGKEKAVRVAGELRQQVDGILQQADQTGQTLDLKTVADKVRAFARQKYFKPGRPSEDFDAAMRVADSIDQHVSLGGGTAVPLSQANEIKRGIYESIGESNFGIDRGATKTAQKVGANRLKRGIERGAKVAGVEDVGPINARESRLLDAAKALTRAVGRESNKNQLTGWTPLIAGGLVGGVDYARNRDPYMAAVKAIGARALLDPAVVSRAAIVAYRLGQNSGALPANVARVAIQATLEAQQETGDVP